MVEEDGYLNVTKHIPYKEEKEDGNNTWKLNESDDLDWIKDIKTNDDIAQEIYDGLEWDTSDEWGGGIPYIARTQWNDIPFSVIPSQKKESPIIIPSVFYKGYRDYMREKWGIYDLDIQKEIYLKIRYLMYQKVKTYN